MVGGLRRVRYWALVGLMGLGLLGLLGGGMLYRLERDYQAFLQQVITLQTALNETEVEVWRLQLRFEAELFSRVLERSLPPTLYPHINLFHRLNKDIEPNAKGILPPSYLKELARTTLEWEKRLSSWSRTIANSPNDKAALMSVIETYFTQVPKANSDIETAFRKVRERIKEVHAQEVERYYRERHGWLMGVGIAMGVWLFVVGVVIWRAGRTEEESLRRAVSAIASGEKMPPLPASLQALSEAYNHLLRRWQALTALLQAWPKYQSSDSEEAEWSNLLGDAWQKLKIIRENLNQLEAQNAELQASLQETIQNFQRAEVELREQIEKLRLELGALQNAFPLAQADSEGAFVFQNDLFAAIAQAEGWHRVQDLPLRVALPSLQEGGLAHSEICSGHQGDYLVYLLPYRLRRGEKPQLIVAVAPLEHLRTQKETLERALHQAERTIQTLEKEIESLHLRLTRLQQSHKAEIERLLRQRESLAALLRNPALFKGEVIEGLSAIAEVAATIAPEAKYSFWVFDEEQKGLHCLEKYDPTLLTHTNTIDLPETAAQWLRDHLAEGQIIGPLPSDQTPLADIAVATQTALYAFPLLMDEALVGAFLIEVPPDQPLQDKEMFFILSKVAALLFQQGHRRLIEKQLLVSLEENQSLVEELRQNIEELEASAEEMRRTQAELRGQIQALNAAALVAELRPDGTIIYVNESFQRLFGYRASDLLGRPYRELRKADDPAVIERLFARLRQGEIWQEVVCYQTAFGEPLWLQQTITPVFLDEGEPQKYILVGFDITLQKQQEQEIQKALQLAYEQEQMLRASTEELRRSNESYRASQMQLSAQLEALNNAAWLFETDSDGNLTYVSPNFLESLGYSAQDLQGKHYGILFSERQPLSLIQGHWRTIQQGKLWKSEVELKGAFGQTFWAILATTPLTDPRTQKLVKTINILVDITEQKEQEFRLKEQQNALSLLASHPALREGNIEKAFQVIAEVTLQTLKAHRVSLWLFEEPDLARCIAAAEKEPHFHEPGSVVNRSLYPLYFQSLELEQIIAVTDALSDLRTRELALPLFKPNHIMSVMDALIRVGNRSVGLISVEQRYAKREWRLDEVNFLRSVAASAASVIEEQAHAYAQKLEQANRELAQRTQELEEAIQNIQESIRYARRIQRNIVPPESLLNTYLGKENYFIIWRSKERNGVGGDFYWFAPFEDRYFIIVADGTGHGVPGAFMSLIGSIFLDQIINKRRVWEPAQILHDLHIEVRQALKQDLEEGNPSRDGMDIAVVSYFPKTHRLIYAGANLPLYYCLKGPDLREIKPDKKPIGGEQLEEERFFTQHEVQLEPGDCFYLFTDGLVDQPGGPEGKRFGTKRFKEFIIETYLEPSMPKRRAILNQIWREWKGDLEEQVDDVTVWGIRIPV